MDSAALTFEMNQKLLVAKDQVNLLNLCRQYHAQSDNLSNITGDNQLPYIYIYIDCYVLV